MKELFAEHGIPEYLCTDSGPQFAHALFEEFATNWKFDHNMSVPSNPRGNGQPESAVKMVKGLLTCAKFSSQDPYIALLPYHSTPINTHLCSPTELPYQWALHTTVTQHIQNTDPHDATDHECLDECASKSAPYHDCCGGMKRLPLFAGQTVSVLNNARNM